MLLQVNHLDAFYGRLQALWDVSVEVEQGEIIALIGEQRSGQVHLPQVHRRFHQAHFGEILFADRDIRGGKPSKIVGSGIVMCPEGRQVFPRLSVRENLRVGGYLAGKEQVEAAMSGPIPASRFEGTGIPVRRHPLRRRAADAGHRPL